MSPLTIVSTLFNLFSAISAGSASSSSSAETGRSSKTEGGDFASSLSSQVAALQMQSATPFPGQVSGSGAAASSTGAKTGATDPFSILGMLQSTQVLPPNWRKLTQFSEASGMKEGMAAIQQASQSLGRVNESMDGESIQSRLQAFANQYNEWIGGAGGTAKPDGVPPAIQTAGAALHQLEQSIEQGVEKFFSVAKRRIEGLQDLGLSIDQKTNLVSVDTTKLDAALTANKTGAINTLQEFSAKFANSAELLSLANDFAAKSTAYLDKALASYARMNHHA
jgi:hypothetical protein